MKKGGCVMSYLAIDVFEDRRKAEVKAEALRQSGRSNVTIKEKNGITVNDCSGDRPINKLDKDGYPLYIILSEE